MFGVTEILYLGHLLTGTSISPDPNSKKLEAVESWPTPQTVTQVRSFLGFTNYFRRFIQGYADLASPLEEITGKGAHFSWNDQRQAAFEQLKKALLQAPVLQLADVSRPFRVYSPFHGTFNTEFLSCCHVTYTDTVAHSTERHVEAVWKKIGRAFTVHSTDSASQLMGSTVQLHGLLACVPRGWAAEAESSFEHWTALCWRVLKGAWNRRADLASPLDEITGKGAHFSWNDQRQAAFEQLKKALLQAPVLQLADVSRPFRVYTDASDTSIAAVLMQSKDDNFHPVAYVSRKLTSAERNYTIAERESLAVVFIFIIFILFSLQ